MPKSSATAGGAERQEQQPVPAMFSVEAAIGHSGLTRTHLYKAVGGGAIEARKAGRRLLIVGDSLRAYLAELPRADIRMGRKAA